MRSWNPRRDAAWGLSISSRHPKNSAELSGTSPLLQRSCAAKPGGYLATATGCWLSLRPLSGKCVRILAQIISALGDAPIAAREVFEELARELLPGMPWQGR